MASANQPTLIEGQTGVGKELFARLIHSRMSPKTGLTMGPGLPEQEIAQDASLKQAEVRMIENALKHHHGNLSKAALALGISRPTLYRKIEAYRIRTP